MTLTTRVQQVIHYVPVFTAFAALVQSHYNQGSNVH